MTSNTIEILYKPYSTDVMGYILRAVDYVYLVINSHLSKSEAEKVSSALEELAGAYSNKLVLLKGDGQVYKTDNLEFLERAC